jgi:hypothetical protein
MYGNEKSDVDSFPKMDNKFFDFLEKYENIEGNILFTFVFVYGIVALYNSIASFFNLPLFANQAYEWIL